MERGARCPVVKVRTRTQWKCDVRDPTETDEVTRLNEAHETRKDPDVCLHGNLLHLDFSSLVQHNGFAHGLENVAKPHVRRHDDIACQKLEIAFVLVLLR